MAQSEDWGLLPYSIAFERQKQYLQERILGQRENTLILVEHPPVYTFGSRKEAQKHLVWDAPMRHQHNIELAQSNRGGDVTYHCPGQLVAYPIVSLAHKKDLHAYLRLLEELIISTLTYFQLHGKRRQGKTGIWIDKKKIAAIGVAARQWVSYHGLALNVNCDLRGFEGIIPCGIPHKEGGISSMKAELGGPVDFESVKRRLTLEFWENFKKY